MLAHRDLIALEILDSEPDPTKFDSVKFLNLIVVFSSFIFEGPGNQPESVDALLFLVSGAGSMIQVVAFCILLQETEASGVWTLSLVDDIVGLVEIYLVVVANNLALRLSLQTHLHDVARLVVEQPVRVAKP